MLNHEKPIFQTKYLKCQRLVERFINVTLATASQMIAYQLRGAPLAAAISAGGSKYSPNSAVTLPAPTVSQLSLYINNIFVNPEIHKIFDLMEINSLCKTKASVV